MFAFEGLKPNARPTDLLGEGFSRRNIQQSIDRGMFYCWAEKVGCCRDSEGNPRRAANYEPCWTAASRTYAVKVRWPESLWKSHKLTHEVYEKYLYLARDGVPAKRRNLDAVREHESAVRRAREAGGQVEESTGGGRGVHAGAS